MAPLKRMPLVTWEQVAQLHKGLVFLAFSLSFFWSHCEANCFCSFRWPNKEHTTKEWVICNLRWLKLNFLDSCYFGAYLCIAWVRAVIVYLLGCWIGRIAPLILSQMFNSVHMFHLPSCNQLTTMLHLLICNGCWGALTNNFQYLFHT